MYTILTMKYWIKLNYLYESNQHFLAQFISNKSQAFRFALKYYISFSLKNPQKDIYTINYM